MLQSLRAAVRSMPSTKDPAWHTGSALEYQLLVLRSGSGTQATQVQDGRQLRAMEMRFCLGS